MTNLVKKDENIIKIPENEDTITEHVGQNLDSWANLPALVIEKVYTYLDRNDQFNMSLTCKNWLNEFGEPGLWKRFKFHLNGHSSTMETWPEIKFTEKFGYMIRHVKIIGELVSANAISNNQKQLEQFLQSLKASGTQLLSIKFINLYDLCQYLTERENSDLYKCTLNLIKSQNKLQIVEFHNTYYAEEDGVKLLKKLCNNCNNLRILTLRKFIDYRNDDNESNPNSIRIYKKLALQFMNLNTLEIDYIEMFENIFRSFQDLRYAAKMIKRLSLVNIYCDGSKRRNIQGIPSSAWKILCKICPNLKIKLTLSYSCQIKHPFELYLVEHMPVVELECRVEKMHQLRQIAFEHLIQQIMSSKINEHIEWLNIVWISNFDNIFNELIPFLNTCPKLKAFQIFLRHPVRGIVGLFEFLLNNRPASLETLYIAIVRVMSREEQLQLTTLADEYIPLFHVIGLNVILTADMP